ncbi:MAG: extracellular solute-binding protein [Treponema sp.]|nr:extracellular solute-binding protein [Treponema sp.]
MRKSKVLFWVMAASLVFSVMFTGCPRAEVGDNVVRVVVFDRGTDGGRTNAADNQWTRWIQEQVYADLGLQVVFEAVSRWTEHDIQSTLMAGGNPPDLMMTWASANVAEWGELGGLFDMAPHVGTYLRDVRAFLGPDQALPGRDFIFRNQNLRTGELFSVPMMRANNARLNVFMRHDWLDALGLPVPTTHEEFFSALEAFRDYNPGNVSRVVPWTMTSDVRWQAGQIIESFIDPNMPVQERWVYIVTDRHALIPGYKEGVRFVNRMYNAGLIDPDFFTYPDDAAMNNLIASGAVGAFGHNWDQVFRVGEGLTTNLQQIVPGARWVAVDAFPGTRISYDSAGLSIFIPRAANNPHGAMQYLNWLARPENFGFLQTGPEGIVHEMVDGLPRINPMAGGGWIQNSPWNIDLTPLQNGIFLGEDTVRMIALGFAPHPEALVMNAHRVAMNNARPDPVILTEQPLIAAGPRGPELQTHMSILLINSIRAAPADFDSVWNAGVENLMALGAREVIEERRANFVAP